MKSGFYLLMACALLIALAPAVSSAGCGCSSGLVIAPLEPIVPATISGSYIGGVPACENTALCTQKLGPSQGKGAGWPVGTCSVTSQKKLGQNSLLGKFRKGV